MARQVERRVVVNECPARAWGERTDHATKAQKDPMTRATMEGRAAARTEEDLALVLAEPLVLNLLPLMSAFMLEFLEDALALELELFEVLAGGDDSRLPPGDVPSSRRGDSPQESARWAVWQRQPNNAPSLRIEARVASAALTYNRSPLSRVACRRRGVQDVKARP
ncbi:uncharacterized protein PGTG_20765 [Puccinia graminis f. sp. tritici CRL 75-36-700-3]|uniref:Uncharacterized protein n=1 Tax=Puccinia graminis f. sp. tritici (strain CRL 75-36-700-3 / race SCCL) TaxID=418459 RepID=H6QP52_PUCGT|nr:uncharacterized protein PGTG_20765 [Puccinia graminis f. sp. tritici CRL 75-36-700-3]EHS63182.1 hypothetical protein PGTG_20765 [Puccinia graminis f. sp. tritici CRL 75-36-700-3]